MRSDTMDGFVRVAQKDIADPSRLSAIDPAATVAVFHTSGTSGFPKGAALSSRALLGARSSTVMAGLLLGPQRPRADRAALVAHHGRQHCALRTHGRHPRLLP